ncbi:MAG: hypothetical protein OXF79_17265 [Chloroflexi bacterium]|nr:hypothetical protein [Chloroflexota bacterium]
MKIPQECMDDIWAAIEKYRVEIEQSNLRESTKKTYYRHALTFVRWLADDFEPGGTLE